MILQWQVKRNQVHLRRDPGLVARAWEHLAFHRARQASEERSPRAFKGQMRAELLNETIL